MVFGITMVWGSPIPATPFFPGWGSEETHPTHQTLVIIEPMLLWSSMRMPNMCPSLKRVTLAPCLTMCPVENACGHLCQIEVCQLLQCGDWVVYPKGTKQGLGASAYLSIRNTSPGCEYTWWTCPHTFIPISGPLQVHTRGPLTQGLSSL